MATASRALAASTTTTRASVVGRVAGGGRKASAGGASARALSSTGSEFAGSSRDTRDLSLCATNGATVFAMRHRHKRHKLSRPSDQRKAVVRSLTTELLRHGRIKTTKPKAKAIVEHVDKVITWAKQASALEGASAEHKKNLAKAFLYDADLVNNVFEEAAERYEDRPGGYTRITPTVHRKGDAAEMVFIELV